jgi:cell division protein FtsB
MSRQSLLLSLAILLLAALVLLIVFGDNGINDLRKLKTERGKLIGINLKLERENQGLYREIKRLKTDPGYVENIARQELGMVGKGEVIIKTRKNTRP